MLKKKKGQNSIQNVKQKSKKTNNNNNASKVKLQLKESWMHITGSITNTFCKKNEKSFGVSINSVAKLIARDLIHVCM